MVNQNIWKRALEDTEAFRSKWLWFWGVEVVGAGGLAGLTAWILWDGNRLHGWQVGLITFAVFVGGFLLIYGLIILWHFLRLRYGKSIILILKGLRHLTGSGQIQSLLEKQRDFPAKWLCPVIERIDLNRQGLSHNDNDVYVKFQIDSHLLLPINEFYVLAKLCLRIPETVLENASSWYEITKPEHYAPIMQLERHRFSEQSIHLLGKTDEEKVLLSWMQGFRSDKPLLAMLKIGIAFKKEDKNSPILLEGSCWIAPMNDYRGGEHK